MLLTITCIFALLPAATLEVRLSSPTRIYLTNAKGELQVPANAVAYRKGKEEHFSIAQTFTIALPAGAYTLHAEKGPEYQPFTAQFTLAENQKHTVQPVLPHRFPMNSRGWYSADMHVHRPVPEIPLLAMTEDLNYTPAITAWVWQGAQRERSPTNLNPLQRIDGKHYFSTVNMEIERLEHGPGAINLIGLFEPVFFGFGAHSGDWLFPPNSHFAQQARTQRAYIDAEKIMWRDIPALAALGHIDFAGVVHNHFNRHNVLLETDRWGMAPKDKPEYRTGEGMALWTLDIYYRLLNCGFHLPVSAGSASGVMASPIGYNRVYAHLQQPFNPAAFLDTMKQGRSFATNGPMLFLTADNRAEPGDTVVLTGQTLHIEVTAETTGSLHRIELIHNGRIIHTASKSFAIDIAPGAPGWLAARAFENGAPSPRFAQTSPIYLTRPGQSVVQPAGARYFIQWLEREAALYRTETRFRSAAHRKAMLHLFESAIAVYRKLAAAENTQP
ncbi:MAG: CehA/McbA family metallohydrolase [Bryobacterales bacterium]|nr:CehA/McbA family metallohydrolase [Bryobacterales bacterium]